MSGSTVTGSVTGTTPFGAVATSLWIGAADSAATTVVYLFNKSVTCAELSPAGWDARITDNTEVLELKMYGNAPASYSVTASLTPAPGEASVNHTFSKRAGTPAEQFSTGGTVTLRALNPSTSALGSFALTFPSGSLNGDFNAVFCPTGVEP